MVQIQLEMFKTAEECEFEMLHKTIDAVAKSSDKVRKGTYARLNEVSKECLDLKTRLDIIEKHICHEGKKLYA